VKENNFKPFKVNDKVWLEGTNLNLPYLTKKLAPRQYGPFRVVVKLHWALWLDLSDDCDVWQKDEWHVSKA
jgi:hypothetical protein